MPIKLTAFEHKIAKQLAALKRKSGSHSPSPAMLRDVSGITVKHDFCFLSNPYATDLFLKYWKRDFGNKNTRNLHKLVEQYPSQNRVLAGKLEKIVGVPAQHIFVGNGATEIIQAMLQNFAKRKILVPVPTFSPYLEFAPKGVKTVIHQLRKEAGFKLEAKRFLKDIQREKPDSVVIINPSNPDGGYVSASTLRQLLEKLRHIGIVIIDESFIHFADKNKRTPQDAARLVNTFPNLVVIKSLSKDFGIAGLRLGYGVMSKQRISTLLARGYLWNISGFGEYFLNLLNNRGFMKEYEKARLLAIRERDDFFTQLSTLKGLKVYPSRANMFLIELLGGSRAEDFMVTLLARYGIYVRLCKDKIGLNGEFIRIASRKAKENLKLVRALKNILSE